MDEIFKERIVEILIDDGTINAESLRDWKVRKEFGKLKMLGKTSKEAFEILADNHCTGIENIKRIVYHK